ncbi:MAG TPA: 23S rRNA (adenine(2030)-N(6))-methyltransferase RlmJ [Rhizomicrobium sp.]
MNYRHGFHAGNFADVIKHIALVGVLLHLRRKEKGFCVIDSHAGAGLYDLAGAQAIRTGEAAAGIGRLADLGGDTGLPDAVRVYLDCVAAEASGHYPGSARIAARLLRPQDRLVAVEKHPEEARALRAAMATFGGASVIEGDGYARLGPLLPPVERRGIALIDPPYETQDEFERAADAVARAHSRFASGIFLLWFPIKSRPAADAFCGEVRARGMGKLLRVDIDVGKAAHGDLLTAAGLLIVNPPFGLDGELQRAAETLAPRLGRSVDTVANILLTAP